jgi:hypothetical protein
MQTKSPSYINGFDWVRAFMSVAVVTWHLHTFGKSLLYSEKFVRFHFNLGDLLNFHFVPVSVPAFLLISCYFIARNTTDWPRLRHRLWRLTLLVVFWTVLLSIWMNGYGGLLKMVPTSPIDLVVTILSANGEFYYFFISLMMCLVMTYASTRLPDLWVWILLAVSLAVTFLLPQVVMATSQTLLIAYWNPLNFLAYPFAAILIFRCQERFLANGRSLLLTVLGLLAVSALFAWYEWTHYVQGLFLVEGPAIPLLMRVSLVFLGAAIVILAMWPWRTAPALVRFMSKSSLALFVLHAFFRPIVLQNTPALGLPDPVMRLLQLTAVVLLCYITAFFLTAFIKEDLIR